MRDIFCSYFAVKMSLHIEIMQTLSKVKQTTRKMIKNKCAKL